MSRRLSHFGRWSGLLSLVVVSLSAWSLPAQAGEPAAVPPDLAILGDSLSTGAAAHPALTFDGSDLWSVFTGQRPVTPRREDLPADFAGALPAPLPAPQRLWPTSREFFGGPDWVWRQALQSLSRAYLDTAEYSWGYLLGAGLGVDPRRVALAGEDGARFASLPRHLDRLLDAGSGTLPRRVAIMYTGNDLCGTTLANVTAPAELSADLEAGLQYLKRNGRPAAGGGTDVYLLSYLGVLQLLHADSILAKKVHAFGAETTCRELRANGYRPADPAAALAPRATAGASEPAANVPWFFQMFMPPNPAAFCPTLFGGTASDREETVGVLANRIRDYREAQAEVVRQLNGEVAAAGGAPALRFHLVRETADLVFTGDDVAQDCFHLSVTGQAKVARVVLAAVKAAELAHP